MAKHLDFKLLPYLKADLSRARLLKYGSSSCQSRLIFWLGIFSFRFLPILLYRVSHLFYRLNIKPASKLFSFLNYFIFGIEISSRCHIGKGLFLPHTHGTVIGAWYIGKNVTIFQGVTIGARELDFSYKEKNRPKIHDNVIIGAGAKLIGNIIIGSNSQIGANAVVINDIPQESIAVGVPARIVFKKFSGKVK